VGGFDTLFIAGGSGAAEASRDTHTAEWLASVFFTARVVQASGNGTLLLHGADLPHARGIMNPIRPQEIRHGSPPSNTLLEVNVDSPVITALSIVKADFDYETAETIAEQLMPNSGRWMSRLLGETPSSDATARIRESTRWMEQHCDRPIRVEDAAHVASMGHRTFLRCFKREVGVTPSEYLLGIRVNMVCKLLVTTTLPIDSIARRCGMGSGAQVARIFKRHLGMSATDYRDYASSDSMTV
jgi:AraC-like DNA-binding protein